MGEPRVHVTSHAIDRFLRRSGLRLSRLQCFRVIAHAVKTGRWEPLSQEHRSRVALQVEGRELHAVICEDGDTIHIVTVLTSAQVASGVMRAR